MKQLVSVIIPAYNAEKWIAECLESALSQTWKSKEIIVVDDGSEDSTLEIAKSYASKMVSVRTQENLGASAARNHALSIAQGDYIQYLDADDVLAPDKIERQLGDAEPGHWSKVLLSSAWGKFWRGPERAKFFPDLLWEDLRPLEFMCRRAEHGLWMAIESWLVSRKLTEMAGPWNESLSLGDDGEYFNRVVSLAEYVRFVPEAKSYIRRGNVGLSSGITTSDRKLDSQAFLVFSANRTLLDLENSDRTRKACLKRLNRSTKYFYPERPDILTEMKKMARDLGGKLSPPSSRLRFKHFLFQRLLGRRLGAAIRVSIATTRTFLRKRSERFIA